MNFRTIAAPGICPRHPNFDAQRGVVLFIALLVMVALSLAGIALIRSADTATVVSGNLAFKQSAVNAVDRSVEQAVRALFDPTTDPAASSPYITDTTVHVPGQNYFACVLAPGSMPPATPACLPANSPIPEIPAVLTTHAAADALAQAADPTAKIPDDGAKNKSYYVIERMCANTGAAVGSNCNLSATSLGSDAGTEHYEGLVRTGGAFFRVTVRVEGPRNTVAYAQAILR
jgi:Tfp pilus assembly protein PilX